MADHAPSPAPSKTAVFARRTGSTLFLWGLVTAIFVSRWSWAYLLLIATLVVIATIEYFRMLRAAGVPCFPRFGIVLAVVYCGVLHGSFLRGQDPPAGLDGFAIFIALAGSFILQLRHPIRGLESLVAPAVDLLGFIYIALLFNFLAQLVFAVPGANAVPGMIGEAGAFILLWVLAVTKFTDMGAYITGSMIGRHKMIPYVSPAKTWEGFAGALVFAQLAACGLFALFPQHLSVFGQPGNFLHVIILGFILSILAVIGDLAESVVKRALGAKDSGRMLPGIGGSLDLIDSVCFTAPATYFYLIWILKTAA